MGIDDLLRWFAGGERRYMPLYHCMRQDDLWIWVTVALDLTVASGYVLIALHWWREQRGARRTAAYRALANMKNIFIFCGLCGYLFIPVKMVWPAWRLYDMVLAVLAVYTWRYAWNSRELRVIYHELTRSDQLVHDLREAQEEAKRKSIFLTAISHDLRTPLNGLALQAQLAELNLERLGLPAAELDQQRESFAAIKAGVQATVELLDRFMELGEAGGTLPPRVTESVEVEGLIRRVVDRYRPLADRKGLLIHVAVDPEACVRTDPARLERILTILVDNAQKFTDAGSIRIDARASGGDLRVDVTDTGIGIASEHLDRLFDEFFQVENIERDRTKGIGLGLATARRLARQLGGTIEVESRVGSGSRFELHLVGVVEAPDPRASELTRSS